MPESLIEEPRARTQQPVLEISNISKTFGGTRALKSFSMDVLPGEVHAFVGQNGSGKSTLVKILSGFHKADDDPSTSVLVDGEPISLHDSAASYEAGLRFVHQDLGLVGTLNAIENLALGRGFDRGFGGRIRWKQERIRAQESLAALGLSFDVTVPVSQLQASERTGIAVARALDNLDGVKLLVIDEPTATLPQTEVTVLFDAIERVRRLGIGVIYISHRLEEIFAIANRVTILRDGDFIATRQVSELDTDELITLMLGREERQESHRSTADAFGAVVLDVKDLAGTTLQGIDFEVRAGEVLGVAGLTGSGRDELSTLLFGGEQRGGTVTVAGVEVPQNDPPAAMKAGIGFVPPDRHRQSALQDKTVAFNCTISDLKPVEGPFGKLRVKAELAEVQNWIDSLDVKPKAHDALFGQLSGGNQQKVVFARWLRRSPSVLLLDEPTQGVDIAAKATIHRLARKAAEDGAAVLMASSDEVELCAICDRVIVLSDGDIVGELTGDDITPERILKLHH